MKKVVLNIGEIDYECFRLEALQQHKSIGEVLRERIFFKPFSSDIEQACNEWIESELNKI